MDSPEEPRGLLWQAIQRPVSVAAGVLLVLFFGLMSIADLPIQLTPDVSPPTISVETRWPGASPLEVEREIVDEQEDVLKRVQGLVRMQSTSQAGSATIDLEFGVGTDLDQALVRVSNQLSQVPQYPERADEPVVRTANASGPPLAVILVRHAQGKSVDPYRTWVEESIVPELERVPGVASVFIRGGRTSEVQIDFDTRALAARGLTVPAVANRIRGELRNSSAGDLDVGKRSILVRTLLAGDRIEALQEVVLATGPDGAPVRVSDVASVRIGLRRATDFAIGDDRHAIALLPRREVGSNVLEVTERLKQVVEDLDTQRFAPEGLELRVVDDQSGYINEALDHVRTNLLIGAGLATLVLLVFLRSAAASLVIALSIPICVLATGLCMVLLGRSVNVVSLAGITFAVGMVVDNSIVALENIDTWRGRVSDVKQAAYRGVKEIWGALLASTATTAAVFIPILLWQGEVGELLRDIAWAIAIAVTISFFVSVLMIPSFAALLFGLRKRARTGGGAVAGFGERARDAIAGLTRFISARVSRALLVSALAIAAAAGIAVALLPKMEYLPTGNRNLVFGIVLPPPGVGIAELQRVGFENQQIMFDHTGKSVDGVPAIHRSFFVGDPARLFIGGVAEDPEQVLAMRDFMQSIHARIPGAIGFASQAALFARGIGEGRAVDLELSGSDLNVLTDTARMLFGQLREVVPGSQVRPQPLLDPGAPEFHVLPDRAQIARVGFLPTDVALIADAYVDGTKLGEFGEEGQPKLDVVLRNAGFESEAFDDQGLLDEPVALPTGELAPFGTLADVETALGPTVIQHIERSRSITLQVTPPDSMPFETALERVQAHVDEQLQKGAIPPSIELGMGGTAGRLAQAQGEFLWILVVAFIILFLLLAALYEDFLAPVVILTTLPLAAAGGVLGLALANAVLSPQPLDLMSALGFLILFGVVVNNAILIVDGALSRLRDGASLQEATSEAVRSRVRPIFMSTLTSLAGLLPMVLTEGSGSELYRGVGTITLGGLTVSTLLSLFVVPALFVLVWRTRRFAAKGLPVLERAEARPEA